MNHNLQTCFCVLFLPPKDTIESQENEIHEGSISDVQLDLLFSPPTV